MKKLTFFLLALLCVFSFSLNAQDETSCNYAAVDWVGNESVNEYQGTYYVNVESYSPAGTSDDGYSATINVNGVSYPLINDGVNGNNIGWYYGIAIAPGGTYNWSVSIETCGGGPAAVSGSYTFHFYGCTYNMGLNYSPANTSDDGSCVFPDWALPVGCMDTTADNYMVYATSEDPDSQCIYDGSWNGLFSSGPAGAPPVGEGGASGPGCTLDEGTTNYNSNATSDDGSCILEDWALPVGCMDTLADNYMVYATNEGPWEMGLGDDPCIFDGSWNGLFSQPAPDMPGCMDLSACNYAPIYNIPMNESCVFAESGYDCSGLCLADADGDGVCDEFEVAGCTDTSAYNFSSSATDDDGSCVAVVVGCLQSDACNYDSLANTSATCDYPPANFDCDGNEYACADSDNGATDAYGDGCVGYTFSPSWCNGYDDSDFVSSEMCCACGGGNSYMLVPGCMNSLADNYNSSANVSVDSLCTFSAGCTDSTAFNYNPAAGQDDGSCIAVVVGCLQSDACNYDSLANTSATCEYPAANFDCDGNEYACADTDNGATDAYGDACTAYSQYPWWCNGYDDSDFSSGEMCCACGGGNTYMIIKGCTNTFADNYDSLAMQDDGSCIVTAVLGCTDQLACNFDSLADTDNGSCQYPPLGSDCDGNVVVLSCGDSLNVESYDYVDNDSTSFSYVFDEGEIVQLYITGETESNYDFVSVFDGADSLIEQFDGSFTNKLIVSRDNGLRILFEADGSASAATRSWIDGSSWSLDCAVQGCTDSNADNFDSLAVYENGSCEYSCASSVAIVDSVSSNTAGNAWHSFAMADNGFASINLDAATAFDEFVSVTLFSDCGDTLVYSDLDSLALDSGTYYLNVTQENIGDLDYSLSLSIVIPGCTDESVNNSSYNPNANFNDGSCLYIYGCMDVIAENYADSANVEDNSCEYIYGCMDPTATNYSSFATSSEGVVCIYPTCPDSDGQLTITTFSNGDSLTVGLTDANNQVLIGVSSTDNDSTYVYDVCLTSGISYTIVSQDFSFAGLSSGSYSLTSCDGLIDISSGSLDSIPSEGHSFTIQSCGDYVFGCTDSTAVNTNLSATADDGSCQYIFGCTDSLACNYVDSATTDNGSCFYAAEGFDCDGNCLDGTLSDVNVQMISSLGTYTYTLVGYGGQWSLVNQSTGEPVDSGYLNNSSSNTFNGCLVDGCYEIRGFSGYSGSYGFAYSLNGADYVRPGGLGQGVLGVDYISIGDGSCDYLYGCMDVVAENYDANAVVSDASLCEYIYGCMDTLANNYDSLATASSDSCTYDFVWGCTDTLACNYVDTADVDDSSCTFAADGFDCDGNCLGGGSLTAFNMASPNWGDGFYGSEYTVTNFDGDTIYEGPDDSGYWSTSVDSFCVSDGCYTVAVTSNGYDAILNYYWSFGDKDGTTGQTVDGINIGTGCVVGCGDLIAENYDSLVQISDLTTCEYIYGCTDSVADNYDSLATVLDSCVYALVQGCMDTLACNFDTLAQQDDGSCYNNDLGCGCDEPAANFGFDCSGNNCSDSTNVTVVVEQNSPNWGDGTYGATYTLTTSDGIVVFEGPQDTGNWYESDDTWDCIPDGCYNFSVSTHAYGGSYGTSYYSWIIGGETFGMATSGQVGLGETGCVFGCLDPSALNYNADADGSLDGSCEYSPSVTCDSANYIALNSSANGYLGSQIWSTFTLESAHIVQASATDGVVSLLSSCEGGDTLQEGRLDAGTYYISVTSDSSAYGQAYSLTVNAVEIPACDGIQAYITVEASPYENLWQLAEDGQLLLSQDEAYSSASDVDIRPVCLQDGSVYTMSSYGIYSAGWYGSNYSIEAECGSGDSLFTYVLANNQGLSPDNGNYSSTSELEAQESFTAVSCDSVILGCMDPIAENYNALADFEYGSCEYIFGCMDTIAENFDTLVTVSDGSCEYITGCSDSLANNYDSLVTFDDGSCDLSLILSCDSSNVFSYSGSPGVDTLFEYSVAEGEIASIEISGYLGSYYGDDVTVYDFAGNVLAQFYYTNAFEDTIFSNDNGIKVEILLSNYSYDFEAWYTIGCAVLGCMDPIAENYDSLATLDNNSCEYIYGCVDLNADNYDSTVTVAVDSVCVYSLVQGCMDSLACNFDTLAEEDNGTCYNNDLGCGCDEPAALEDLDCDGNCLDTTAVSVSLTVREISNGGYDYSLNQYGGYWMLTDVSSGDTVYDGSTDNFDVNCLPDGCYNISGETGSGSSYAFAYSLNGAPLVTPGPFGGVGSELLSFGETGCVLGCLDPTANNYDTLGLVHIAAYDSCTFDSIPGCMVASACNYNPDAVIDNNTCEYPPQGLDCRGECLDTTSVTVVIEQNSPYYGDGAYYAEYSLTNSNGDIVAEGPQDTGSWYESDDTLNCIPDGCYEFAVTAPYGSTYATPNYYNWVVAGQTFVTGQSGQVGFGELGCVTGCMDLLAENYNPDAHINDASLCEYIYGCMDTLANNYDSLATASTDSSCTYDFVWGCTDTLACNYADSADVDDNSCTYAAEGFDCEGNCLEGVYTNIQVYLTTATGNPTYSHTGNFGSWNFTQASGIPLDSAYLDNSSSDLFDDCVPDGCYLISGSVGYAGYYFGYELNGGDMNILYDGQLEYLPLGDNSCEIGCMDTLAENYSLSADISSLDSCVYAVVTGCTDTLACNYDSLAVQDNGTCSFPDVGFNCDGSCVDGSAPVTVEQNSPNWGDGTYGATYTLSQDGVVVFEGPQDTGNWYESDDTWDCIPDGCYNFSVSTHIYGGSYSTSYYSWIIGGETFGMATSGLVSLGETAGCVTGCMDPSAENYNPDADISSLDSCTYDFVLGCMDTLACNYDVLADTSNVNSCSYPELGQDCDGNLVPLVCGDASNVGSYEYVNSDYTTFEYVFPEGEIATLTIAGETETAYSGGCYDYVYVFDGAGSLIQSLCGVFDQTIVSNDNGISFTFDSDGSASASTGSVDGSSWSLDCAVQGCTDPGADNYNPLAQFDNGSCVTSCPDGTGSVAVIVIADTYVSQETSYSLTGDNGFSFFYDFTNDDNMDVITNEFCIPNGTNMSFVITDTNGDGLVPPSGYEIQVCDQSLTGQLQFISSNSETHEFQVMCGDVYGCDDASALNYDSDATINDGSCDYPCLGLEAVVTHTASSQFAFEQSWYIMNTSTSQTVASGPNVPEGELWNGPQEVQEVCLTEGADYMLYMLDSDGDGWNNGGTGGSISIESPCGMLVENAEGTASVSSETFTACVVNPCPAPDSWATTVTGSNHTIVIPSGSIVSLSDGSTLDHANVGVFFTDSLGNLVCAGSTQVSPGETAAIAAMGDDTTTPEVDGLVAGEEFMWMIADCNGNVFAASATYSPISVNSFLVNGVSYVTAITEVSEGPSSQVIDLPNGWSMFSTYMIADDMDMASVLAPIIDDVVIAKNNSGSAYLVEWNFNGVGSLLVGQGYQIKTEAEVSLEISGAYATPEDHSVALSAGWNMIGYLRTESAAADAVLADINSTGNLIIAKDYNGQAYLPEWNFNGIGDMNPGEGYQLKTNNADVLQFLSNDESYRMSTVEVIENNVSHFAKVVPTDNNMTVVIDDAVWDVLPSEGAEIAAFDKDGNQVGSAIYSSPVTVIAIWGDDATSSSKDGMEVSEPVSFKVWNTNDVRDFTVSKWIEGSSSYQVDAINIASSIETNTIMTELNTPVRVLVKVINVLGQEVNMDDEPFKGTVLFKVYDDGSVERYVR